jgi:hypothetical protein
VADDGLGVRHVVRLVVLKEAGWLEAARHDKLMQEIDQQHCRHRQQGDAPCRDLEMRVGKSLCHHLWVWTRLSRNMMVVAASPLLICSFTASDSA